MAPRARREPPQARPLARLPVLEDGVVVDDEGVVWNADTVAHLHTVTDLGAMPDGCTEKMKASIDALRPNSGPLDRDRRSVALGHHGRPPGHECILTKPAGLVAIAG